MEADVEAPADGQRDTAIALAAARTDGGDRGRRPTCLQPHGSAITWPQYRLRPRRSLRSSRHGQATDAPSRSCSAE